MLILSRKPGESFYIGETVEITVLGFQNDKIKVGIKAPEDVVIIRRELKETMEANLDSAGSSCADAETWAPDGITVKLG
jgi:carbon storage regulator